MQIDRLLARNEQPYLTVVGSKIELYSGSEVAKHMQLKVEEQDE
jgi:hypothetical protein